MCTSKNGIISSPNGIRKSSTNKSFERWLPILINSEDWNGPKKIKQQFLSAVNGICANIKFAKDEHQKVFKVCSSLMNSLVVEIMQNANNATANDKFINGYFSIYRLLEQYAEDNKRLITFCNDTLQMFMDKAEARVKSCVPNLGKLLMHLTISTKLTWQDICNVFMGECDARNVFWYCVVTKTVNAPHRELVNTDYKGGDRAMKVFNATAVSRNSVMFQIKFANVT